MKKRLTALLSLNKLCQNWKLQPWLGYATTLSFSEVIECRVIVSGELGMIMLILKSTQQLCEVTENPWTDKSARVRTLWNMCPMRTSSDV
jgi:hypothetical protein